MERSTQGTAVNIRQSDRNKIIASLQPGHIIQVCGPPMVGKSTLVDQVIDDSSPRRGFVGYRFICENLYNFHDVLNVIAVTLGLQPPTISSVNDNQILSLLASALRQFPESHHVLVFHKCEGLQCKASREGGHGDMLLDFVWRLIHLLSGTFKLSVVLTSSKTFPLTGQNVSTVEIEVLDFWDVESILQHYAPNVNVLSYVYICSNALPLPGAVRLFAEEYLAEDLHRQSPEKLEEDLQNDENFWSAVFGDKLDIVETWVPPEILASMVHFCHTFGSSFTKDHLGFVLTGHNRLKWIRLIKYLKRKYVVWTLPGTSRLAVHPLLVYYTMQCRSRNQLVLQGQWYDHSSNRYTDFLCRLLHTVEFNMEKHGKKGLVYGCLALEWPHIRHMIEMALSCNENTFKTFLKAAVSARGIILKCFNEEGIGMYEALYNCAKDYGTASERAVVEAILGHCKASTVVLAKGGTWKQAEDCLDSAIATLRKTGPTFALMWAIYRKGIILTRQAKYKEAQMCFIAAKRVTVMEADDCDLEGAFGISKLQVKEEKITRDIYRALALIYLGENDLAQERLLDCYQDMQSDFADHSELATLLNSLGLIEERGHGNRIKALEWYMESYRVRLNLPNREILIVSLNNIGMIFLRLGKIAESKKYLEEALRIRRDLGWVHANTALTLMHLGFLNFKCGDLAEAFTHTRDADKILLEILKNHDTRLRINNTLGHLSQLLGKKDQHGTHQKDEEIKLEKSPMEYFEYSLEIASRLTGNLSDDGYHHLFIAHEHEMLLALGNSKEKYNEHKNLILPYFKVSKGIGRKVFSANNKIPNHMDLYSYFSAADYEDIDKSIFIGHLVKACEFCQMAISFCPAEKMWCGDMELAADCEQKQDACQIQLSDPLSSHVASEHVEDILDSQILTVSSGLPGSSCLQQDQQSLPESPDNSLTLPLSESKRDLQGYVVQYLSFASDPHDQNPVQSSPKNTLILPQMQSNKAMDKQQTQLNKEKEQLFSNKVGGTDISPANDSNVICLAEDNCQEITIEGDHEKNLFRLNSPDCTKFTQSVNTLRNVPPSSEEIKVSGLKIYDEYRHEQHLLPWENRNRQFDNSEDNARSIMQFSTTDSHGENTFLLDNKKYHSANRDNPDLPNTVSGSLKDCMYNNNEIMEEYNEDDIISEFIIDHFNEFTQNQDKPTYKRSQTHYDNVVEGSFSDSLASNENFEVRDEHSSKSTLLLNNSVIPLDLSNQVNKNYQQGFVYCISNSKFN